MMSIRQQNSSKAKRPSAEEDDWGGLKDDVGGIADAAVAQGRHFIGAAKDQATGYADRRKADVAQSVADFAASLRESTRSFDERPNIQAVVDSAAEGLEQLADTIRESSYADILADVEAVVRQRPMTFGVASLAVGFLAARFIKSSAEDLRAQEEPRGGRPRNSTVSRHTRREG